MSTRETRLQTSREQSVHPTEWPRRAKDRPRQGVGASTGQDPRAKSHGAQSHHGDPYLHSRDQRHAETLSAWPSREERYGKRNQATSVRCTMRSTMTPGGSAFWIYLFVYGNLAGIAGIVLGLVARFAAMPFNRVFLSLAGAVAVMSITSSALTFNLASQGHAFASFRLTCLITPLVAGPLLFFSASGLPVSRVLGRR